jgi:hypothetical protein
MSFDTSTGAGVATVNTFMFFGDAPGSGINTNPASALGVTFQVIDTVGTMVGSMLFSYNGVAHSVSIVLNAAGMFGGPAALAATEGYDFNPKAAVTTYPLGPIPAATTTFNTGAGCDGLTLATQVNAYTINTNMANVFGTCAPGGSVFADATPGDPMTSSGFSGWNANFDIMTVTTTSFVPTPTGPVVPVPAAVWLFGSGLLGLAGIARRKKKA